MIQHWITGAIYSQEIPRYSGHSRYCLTWLPKSTSFPLCALKFDGIGRMNPSYFLINNQSTASTKLLQLLLKSFKSFVVSWLHFLIFIPFVLRKWSGTLSEDEVLTLHLFIHDLKHVHRLFNFQRTAFKWPRVCSSLAIYCCLLILLSQFYSKLSYFRSSPTFI